MDRINIIGVIGWDVEEESTVNQINEMDGDFEVFIASAGGYIFPGISILNAIREYDKGEVTAIVSFAASMGTQIALACDKVKVFDNAPFMIHNASGIAWGDYREMERYGEYLKRLNSNIGKLYAKKSKKPLEEILSLMDDETWYFGEEIVENVLKLHRDLYQNPEKLRKYVRDEYPATISTVLNSYYTDDVIRPFSFDDLMDKDNKKK